jgi:hypothetical protein
MFRDFSKIKSGIKVVVFGINIKDFVSKTKLKTVVKNKWIIFTGNF